MRVYELARELGVKSDEVLRKCGELGLKQKNRLGGVTAGEAAALRKALARKKLSGSG